MLNRETKDTTDSELETLMFKVKAMVDVNSRYDTTKENVAEQRNKCTEMNHGGEWRGHHAYKL